MLYIYAFFLLAIFKANLKVFDLSSTSKTYLKLPSAIGSFMTRSSSLALFVVNLCLFSINLLRLGSTRRPKSFLSREYIVVV